MITINSNNNRNKYELPIERSVPVFGDKLNVNKVTQLERLFMDFEAIFSTNDHFVDIKFAKMSHIKFPEDS